MPILNYTTTVAASRSIGQVQSLLVKGGARAIMSEYGDDGTATGISFAVETEFGQRAFTLPVNAEKVHAVLKRQRVQPRYATMEHAERVAWRILKDWLEAQLAIIQTEMVTLDQVMLPYMQGKDGRSVYELIVENQLALPSANGTHEEVVEGELV
jgi:hypothetical protein